MAEDNFNTNNTKDKNIIQINQPGEMKKLHVATDKNLQDYKQLIKDFS